MLPTENGGWGIVILPGILVLIFVAVKGFSATPADGASSTGSSSGPRSSGRSRR